MVACVCPMGLQVFFSVSSAVEGGCMVLYLRVVKFVSMLTRVEGPVRTRVTRFRSLFHIALRRSGPVLTITLRRIVDHGKGVVHPVLILLTTGVCKAIGSTILRTTLDLRVLRATSLIRSSIISRDNRHEKRGSIGSLLSGGTTILINSCVLSASLGRTTTTNDLQIISLITLLKRALSSNRLRRLSGLRSSRVGRRRCFRIVHGGATSLFTIYTRTKKILSNTTRSRVQQVGLFNRRVNLYFRVHSSIFSCCSARVKGPANGSVGRNGLALPIVCTVDRPKTRQ